MKKWLNWLFKVEDRLSKFVTPKMEADVKKWSRWVVNVQFGLLFLVFLVGSVHGLVFSPTSTQSSEIWVSVVATMFVGSLWCIVVWMLPDENQSSLKPLRFLRAFRYFRSRSGREFIELTIHDLKLDIKEMRREGRSERFIKIVIFWRSLSVVVTMIWAGIVEPVVKVWAALKAK